MIYFFLFFLPLEVHAISLIDQLNIFFKTEYPKNKNNIDIIIHTPLKKYVSCNKPRFTIINSSNNFSLFNILSMCGTHKQYLKVELHTKREYVISSKKISKGQKIRESDLKSVIGRLDMLPHHVYLKKQDLVNSISACDILPLQPITSFMTRPFWSVNANQQVAVIINGIDFRIITQGKSLNNAFINENVRVKIENGKIVDGVVSKDREVVINL